MDRRHITALLLVALTLTGCLPWAVPPMKIEGSIGPKIAFDDDPSVVGTVQARAGIVPVLPTPKMLERPIDASLGWQFVPTLDGRLHHGPFLEGGYFFHTIPTGTSRGAPMSAWRFGFHGRGFPLFNFNEPELGVGGALQISADYADFISGPVAQASGNASGLGFLLGYAHGERSIGGFAEIGYASFPTEAWSWLSFGLTFRNPASAGILIGIPFGR